MVTTTPVILGNPDARVLFIAGTITPKEQKAGRLMGQRASVVAFLRKAGLHVDDYGILALVPETGELKKGGPSQKQLRKHLGVAVSFLETTPAEVLVPLGPEPLKALFNLPGGLTKHLGYFVAPSKIQDVNVRRYVQIGTYKSKGPNRKVGDPRYGWKLSKASIKLSPSVQWILPFPAPDSLMTSGFTMTPVWNELPNKLTRYLDDELELVTSRPWHTSPRAPNLALPITVDIETLQPPNDWTIIRLGVNDGEYAWTAEWANTTARKIITDLLTDPRVTLRFYNANFDVPRLEAALNVTAVATIEDVMVGVKLLDSDLLQGLGASAPRYLDLEPWKSESEDPALAASYNAKDVLVQHALGEVVMDTIEDTGQRAVFDDIMSGLPELAAMELRGIYVDRKAAEAFVNEHTTALSRAMRKWRYPSINPGSWRQLQTLLYSVLKLPPIRSAKGSLSTDASTIRRHLTRSGLPQSTRESLELLLKIRHHQKLLSTYTPAAEGFEKSVHPRYIPSGRDPSGGGGARSGRIQPRNPNLSNQPPEARYLYIPESGYSFISIDWSSLEAWIEATLSGDELLMEALSRDLHATTSKAMGCDRTRAKAIFYTTGRLGGAKKITEALQAAGFPHVTTSEVRAQQQQLFNAFPDWTRWRQRVIAEAESKELVRCPFGRLLRLYSKRKAPAAIGFMPQATAAAMLWRVLGQLPKLLEPLNAYITTTIHDEVLLSAPNASAGAAATLAQECMEQEFPEVAPGFSVATKASIGEPGASWGTLK